MENRLHQAQRRIQETIRALGIADGPYFARLVDQLPLGIGFFSAEGTLEGFNQELDRLLGLQGRLGKKGPDLPYPLDGDSKLFESLVEKGIGTRRTDFVAGFRLIYTVHPGWEEGRIEILLTIQCISTDSVVIVAKEDVYQRYATLLRNTNYCLLFDPEVAQIPDDRDNEKSPVKAVVVHHAALPGQVELMDEFYGGKKGSRPPFLYVLPDEDHPLRRNRVNYSLLDEEVNDQLESELIKLISRHNG